MTEIVNQTIKLKASDPAYFRDYYHKDNEFVMCECGSSVTSRFLKRHSKQPKHLRLIEIKKGNVALLNALPK